MNTKMLKCGALVASVAGCAGAARGSGLGIADFQWEIFDNAGGNVAITKNEIEIVGGNSFVPGVTGVSTIALDDIEVLVDWSWVLLDDDLLDWGFYFINDEEVIFTLDAGGAGSGSAVFFVNGGDVFGFGVETADGFLGPGILSITHIKAIPAPSGAAVFALAGLAAARRRRSA